MPITIGDTTYVREPIEGGGYRFVESDDDPPSTGSSDSDPPESFFDGNDDAGMTDPDAGDGADEGDTTTRELRDDAQSDPFNEQTVVVGDDGGREPDGRPSLADQQGIETDPANRNGAVTPEEAAIARQFEQAILADNPELDEGDVAIVQTADGDYRAVLTQAGRRKRREEERREQAMAGPGGVVSVAPSDVITREQSTASQINQAFGTAAPGPGDSFIDVSPSAAIPREQGTAPVVSVAPSDVLSRRRAAVLEQIDDALEGAVGRERTEFNLSQRLQLGVATGGLDVDPGNLVRGEDYTVDIDVTPTGISASAELTPEFLGEFRGAFAERELETQFRADFDPGEDFTIDEQGTVSLTEAGERTIAVDPEERFGEGGFLPERFEEPIRGAAFDYSQFVEDFTQPIEQADPGDVVLDTEIDDLLRAGGVSDEHAERVEELERTFVRQGLQLANVPSALIGLEEIAEFNEFQVGEVAAGRAFDRFNPEFQVEEFDVDPFDRRREVLDIEAGLFEGGSFGRTEAAAGDVIRAGGEAVGRDPLKVTAGLAGSLVGSAAIMGGAARLSRRAGLASRLAIQPGEELLGFGGHFATKAVAGTRTADRLFPNKEPLIFSEEAALRTGRRLAGSSLDVGRRGVGRVREAEFTTPDVSPAGVLESARTEVRSAPLNLAAARFNLGQRVRGAPSSFRQAAVRGDLDAGDINMIETGEFDVPTRGGTDPFDVGDGGGGGSMQIGGSFTEFDVERRTDSGVVVERVVAPVETRGESDLTADLARELEGRSRGATRPRVETSFVSPIADVGGLSEGLVGDLSAEFTEPFGRSDLVSDVISDTDQRGDLDTDLFREFDFAQDLSFDTETFLELELERDRERRRELEIEADRGERPRRDSDLMDPFGGGGFRRRLDRSLINPFTGV